MSSNTQRRNNEQHHVFTRQATILRKNLSEWDYMLRTPKGELWPTMVRAQVCIVALLVIAVTVAAVAATVGSILMYKHSTNNS
jgi:hypothetical protein